MTSVGENEEKANTVQPPRPRLVFFSPSHESLFVNVLSCKVVEKSGSTGILAKCSNLLFDIAPSINIRVSNLGAITCKKFGFQYSQFEIKNAFDFKN